MRLKNKKNKTKELLCYVIVLAGLVMYYSGMIATVCRGIILLAALPLIGLVIQSSKRKTVYYVIFFFSLFLGIINYLFIHQITITRILIVSIGYYAVGLYLGIEKKLSLRKWWGVLFIGGFMWVLFRYVQYGAHTFPTYNRNHVSTILLVLLFFLVYCFDSNKRTVPIYYYILTFAFCIAAIGRGGIIASGFMMAMIILRRGLGLGINEKWTTKRFLGMIVVITTMILLVPVIASNIELLETRLFSRFVSIDNTVINSNYKRQIMLLDYLEQMKKPVNLIFGIDTQHGAIRYAEFLGGNVHNAFFNAHADFGILGLLTCIYGTIFGVYRIWKYQYCESAIVLASFFVRSLTDDVWRNSFGGILIWVAIIFAIEERRKQ